MIVKSLKLNQFRNYESLQLSFDKGTNLFYGNNAQGKTNISKRYIYAERRNPIREVKTGK